MRKFRSFAVLAAAACLSFSLSANAQDRRAVQQLEDKGFKRCARAAGNVLEFLYDKQSYAYLNTWHAAAPDRHVTSTLTTRPEGAGHAIGSVVAAPTPDGGCDAAFSQIVPLAQPCAKVHESTFRDWKRSGEMSGVPVYADPTAPNVVVMLFPATRETCLVLKSGVLYF
jgi:hypothetical protein